MMLVVGASGRLGGTIARHLLSQGERVRVLTRTPAKLEHLEVLGAEVVGGDLREPTSLKSACQGVAQVITTAHAGEGKGTNVPRSVDEAGNRHLIDAAKAAGVGHFVFISTHGARPDSPVDLKTEQSPAPTVPRLVNAIVKAILRSPLHGLMSKNRMLLTFRGRKSGKGYTTPVSYFREGESIVCFTDSSWWKNLRGGAPVRMRLVGRDVAGMASPIDTDTEAIARGLERMLQKIPSDGRYYQVTVGPHGQLSASDLMRAAHSNVMIRIHLVNEGEQGPVV